MKRTIIAVLFLTISISLCIFEQYTIKDAYKTVTEYTDRAIAYTNTDDYKNAEKICKTLNDYWDKKYPYLSAMIDHAPLDEAGLTISSLEDMAKNEDDDLHSTLITAKNQIETIYHNQRITLGNIF